MTAVLVIVMVFFVAGLGAMVRAEMKTLERRETNPFAFSRKSRSRTLNGTYIIK